MEQKCIVITVDVEDWFHVENLRTACPSHLWDSFELRVEKNVDELLGLFAELKIRATFFVLGWVAERASDLVKKIYEHGHEVASHGFWHNICSTLSPSKLKEELKRSKELLEDIIGSSVVGFRAPNFSVTQELLIELKELGYIYDSSYNSFKLNPRYGKLDNHLIKKDIKGILQSYNDIFEIPISNLKVRNIVLPAGGGAYFRIYPFFLFKFLVKYILRQKGWYVFYMHPWEIDPTQPKVRELSLNHRFRHYTNLDKTYNRLKKMCWYFKTKKDVKFVSCSDLINEKIFSHTGV